MALSIRQINSIMAVRRNSSYVRIVILQNHREMQGAGIMCP